MIFKNWIIQNFPFLEDDFDALTDYELFCKMIEYVKTLVKDNKEFKKQLQDLENYIYNLNLQDEVNNKLDEMAQDGTLENIISQYIELMTTYTYNNIAEMKSATNLVNGSFARTSGFYSYNDGGGALYKIRTLVNTDVIDEITLIALNEPTLVAELLKQDIMNVRQFGAKGDGVNDDSVSIQKALSFNNNIIIKDGIYMIDSVNHNLSPIDNSYIKLINSTLKAITNNSDNYAIMRLYQVENVIIEGGIFEGDRETHTAETGEWGHCIAIRESKNITLKNITLKNAWGDGLYVVDSSNINTYNIIADSNRRNGYSIISADGFSSNNDYICNTNGTAPQSGVDIEPNEATEILKNIVFNNLKSYNNSGSGFEIHLSNADDTTAPINIELNNYYDEESNFGVSIYKNQYTKGEINVLNANLYNNKRAGINLRQCYDSNLHVNIDNPTIINCNTTESTTPKYASGISLYLDEGDTDLPLGNVSIITPYITNKIANQRYMYIVGTSNNSINDFHLINPRNNDNNKNLTMQYLNNLLFKDEYEKFALDSNNTMEFSNYNTYSKVTNSNYTTSRTNTITASYPIGREMTFINTNYPQSYNLAIKLPTGTYIHGLTNTEAPTITLASTGDLITIKRISSTDFILTNKIGNITAS